MGKLVSGVLGVGGESAQDAKPAIGGSFQPFTYTGLAGTARGAQDGQGFNFSQTLDPALQELYGQGLRNSGPFLDAFLAQSSADVPDFNFEGADVREREQEIYNQQLGLLQPGFAQQNQQLQQDLYGSGRLGLQVSGEGVGAGRGTGMVNPDAYGLSLAQSRAIAELGPQSRVLANQEQAQDFAQQSGGFGLNQSAQDMRLRNLLGGFQGAFGTAQGVQGIEQGLIGQAAGFEQARSDSRNSAYAAGTPATPRKPGLLEQMAVAYANSGGFN